MVESRNDRVENDWGLGWNGAYFLRKRKIEIDFAKKQTNKKRSTNSGLCVIAKTNKLLSIKIAKQVEK